MPNSVDDRTPEEWADLDRILMTEDSVNLGDPKMKNKEFGKGLVRSAQQARAIANGEAEEQDCNVSDPNDRSVRRLTDVWKKDPEYKAAYDALKDEFDREAE